MATPHHAFVPDYPGDGCGHLLPSGKVCGRAAEKHRTGASRAGETGRQGSPDRVHMHDRRARPNRKRAPREPKPRPLNDGQPWCFVDSEGFGRAADHRLVYGAVVDDAGKVVHELEGPVDDASRRGGLRTGQWLDFLLDAAERAGVQQLFGYGLGYDRTMMLRDLALTPDGRRVLWMLNRREDRPLSEASTSDENGRERPTRPKPLYWGDYILDLQGTCFRVSKLVREPAGRPAKSDKGRRVYRRVVVWDVLKFFQAPFCDALDAWRRKSSADTYWHSASRTHRAFDKTENLESQLVVPSQALEDMRDTKAQRSNLEALPWQEVKDYCLGECVYGAQLVREMAGAVFGGLGVSLRRYDGAGSVSDALMRQQNVHEAMSAKNVTCRRMSDVSLRRPFVRAVMGAFAGGRFESAYCGVVRRPVHGKDICSAYPYAMYQLPCLACGTWEHVSREAVGLRKVPRSLEEQIEGASLALLRVRVHGTGHDQAYGSLAHRDPKGNIRFPLDCETWCWRPEYLAARDHMRDRVEVLEAYLYKTPCEGDHRPFRFMSQLYLERLRVGKEGRGIALKLAYNGCAGKTMQHVGSARWQEYVWAGMTTSTTRAQLLRAISLFRDPWDVAYVATDSVYALQDVALEDPAFTGTATAKDYGKMPLGGWEHQGKSGAATHPHGMVFMRPGIAFPLFAGDATKETKAAAMKEIKARGVSKSVMLDAMDRVVAAFEGARGQDVEIPFQRRIFGGCKMSMSSRGKGAERSYHVRTGDRGMCAWYEDKVNLRCAAQPKRLGRLPGADGRLLPWIGNEVFREVDMRRPSMGYGETPKSAEAQALAELQDMLLEQEDLDGVDCLDGFEG